MNFLVKVSIFCLMFTSVCAQDDFETMDAVVGQNAELPCNITAEVEGDKLNILVWYINGSSTAFYSSRDLRGGDDNKNSPAQSDRYRLITAESEGLVKLQIDSVEPGDAGAYHCMADFAASPALNTFIRLNVIEPPKIMWIVENGKEVANTTAGVNISHNIGPYYVGDTIKLFCVAFGGNPQASLSWWRGEKQLKVPSSSLSRERVRSFLSYGPLLSEDHGRVLSCFASNNHQTTPLSIDIVIDMYIPAELVSLRAEGHESGRVKAGDTLDLQCRVLGARPPPPILWRLNDYQLVNLEQNITLEGSQRLVTSGIQLSIDRKYDEASLSCCVPEYTRTQDQYVCSEKLPLTVLYPPSLKILVDKVELKDNSTLVVAKGTDITMSCAFEANPAVFEISWFHGDDIMPKESGNKVQAILELPSVSESEAGEYVCSGKNSEGLEYSEPIYINVTYPAYCEDESIAEYGLGENESVNLTCNVKASPEPVSYRWVMSDDVINVTTFKEHAHNATDTEDNVLVFQRTNTSTYSTVLCWGINDVSSKELPQTPCTFLVTDETMPRPPVQCTAVKNAATDILVTCDEGHDGGLPQSFKLLVQSVDSNERYLSITTMEPHFMITEPKQDMYKFVIIAFNDKGESKPVVIEKEDIVDNSEVSSIMSDITTLSLSLCGGVLVVALAACGLVLCAHERASSGDVRVTRDPPLCAYNTEESNCDTYHGSEDGSEFNVRRTESFRRAMARYPSKNFDVRRTSSFHSARYIDPEPDPRCSDMIRHNNCRVHSMQNISRKRDMDALCDHLVLHLPPETNYNVPRPMNTFYTMPRKSRQKLAAREISDEVSEITQTSDGFSLPPPPDEFGTYRAATRIKDIPSKTTPTYTTVVKRSNETKEQARQPYTTMSPMNTVGIPTISGTNSIYSYPDDPQGHHQVNTNPFDEDSS